MTGILSNTDWLAFMAGLAIRATVILALAAAAAALLWRASAAVRHLVWCVGVIGVLALPLFSAVLPAWELPLLPAREAPASFTAAAPAALDAPALLDAELGAGPAPMVPAAERALPSAPAAATGGWLPRAAALVVAGGAVAGLLWLVLGFWGVSRLGRRSQVVGDAAWLRTAHEAAAQLGLRRPVLLLRASGSVMPATGGILWPVIVVPEMADAWPEDRRRAVLAHELAHVKRYDCLTQALAQVACALFWWHPAVWYAARRLRVERERACDDLVLRAGTRASEYAAHLLEVARAHKSLRMATPALVSMARPSHLESRLLWVLDAARPRGVPSPRATVLAVLMGLLAVGSLSAVRPVAAAPSADRGEPAVADGASVPEHRLAATEHEQEDGKKDHAREKKEAAHDREAERAGDAAHAPAGAGAGRSAAAGDTIPSVEQLIEMRAVGVNAAYVAEMRAAGYGGLTVDQLVDLRVHGVTRAYADAVNGLGLGRLSPGQLEEFAAMRVTPEYVAELRRHGYDRLSAREIINLRAVRVDGVYIQAMAAAGYPRIPAGALADLRAVGVTPAYVAELERQGLRNLPIGRLEDLRALGVTGAYVEQMRAAGYDNLSAAALEELRAVRVTPEYIRELAGVGLTRLSVDQLTELRVHGVTAAYVRELQAAGLAPASPEQLVRLRVSGVGRELIDARKKQ